MNPRTLKNALIGGGIAVLLWTTVPFALAQSTAQSGRGDMQAMMGAMQADQKKLDELVAQMNAATGLAKVDRIAAVVNEMASMHKRMMGMMMHGEPGDAGHQQHDQH